MIFLVINIHQIQVSVIAAFAVGGHMSKCIDKNMTILSAVYFIKVKTVDKSEDMTIRWIE